jgi:hypothetical protein
MTQPRIVIRLLENIKGHWYRITIPKLTDFEIVLPSSTTILECFPNPELDMWKTNTSPAEIKEKQETGKLGGSKFHHCADITMKGSVVSARGLTEEQIKMTGLSLDPETQDKKLIAYLREPLTEREGKCLIGFENFWADMKPYTVGNELTVANYKKLRDGSYDGYAGTLDWIGYLMNPKTKQYELWIIDWKTSKSPSKTNSLQIVSYLKAFEFTFKKKLKGVRLGVAYFGNTTKKKYTLSEVKDYDKFWKAFQLTKKLWDFVNPKKMPSVNTIQGEYSIDTSHKVPGKILSLTPPKRHAKKQSNLPLPKVQQDEEPKDSGIDHSSEPAVDVTSKVDDAVIAG